MAKEKCWRCNKSKSNVKLRACNDRLCEECYEVNESLLRKVKVGVADTADIAVDVTVPRKPVATSKSDNVKLVHAKNDGRHDSTESASSTGEGILFDTTDKNSLKDCDTFAATKTTPITDMSTGIADDEDHNYCPI